MKTTFNRRDLTNNYAFIEAINYLTYSSISNELVGKLQLTNLVDLLGLLGD